MKSLAGSYAQTARLVYGEPNLPTGTRVWVRQRIGTARRGYRYEVQRTEEREDWSAAHLLGGR